MSRLQAIGLTKHFEGSIALDRLDLRIEAGEVFCLLGPNGAGKTTTINLFLNFIAPTAGRALVSGLDVREHPTETKADLAYIPEQVSLYGNLSGLENLRFFSALAGHRDYTVDHFDNLFERVGLTAAAARRPLRTYSKGMRQKVGIAIALAKNAKVLLLDEPTAGLDPAAANEFALLLDGLRQNGAAILMTTHDLFRAKASGTRVGMMIRGRLMATLDTADVTHGELERLYLEHASRDPGLENVST